MLATRMRCAKNWRREKNIIVSLRTVERAVAPLWREFFLAERARQAAFEWMRSVLQKDINLDVLRREVGDVPDIETLLQRLYDGRLSDRNRSMVVLANRRGAKRPTCLQLPRHRQERRTASTCGRSKMEAALRCSRARSRSTRKFDDETIKQAVFGLLHEPPSNYGINRTTWIMSDLTRVLRETGHPACPASDPQDHQGGRLPLAQGAHRTHVIRPELHREA